MERAKAAAPESQAGAKVPMEPVGNLLPRLEQPQVPAETRQPEGPESSPTPAGAGEEAAGAGREPSSEKQLPSPRPGPLRVPPLSLGYGPRSPGPLSAETPRNSEAPGAEPASGAWAPIELQVDVLVKPVGAAGGSSPASPAEGSADSPSSRTCCRCKELGLEKEGAALLPCAELHRDKKLPRAVTHLGLSMYMKSLRRALAVMAVLLAVSGVVIVVLASRAGARCQPCPPGWVLSEEHCYYLSAEAQAWEASQAFCSAYHATLPLLSHTQDLLSRYPVSKHSWVGARRGPQGWHWIDGAPMPPQLLPEDGENNSDINCGALEEGTLVAANCSTPRPWVCAKGTQ
uniref:Killer cell lectin like receptor G2 n=1 Tax=Saimiri boliviensis boliviensis TaxID=39432 RepID=A0A2K6U8G3_SAIBB